MAEPSNRGVRVLTVLVVALQAGLVAAGLVFRATLYARLPVAPGEPYGIGDVIELLLYYAVLGGSAIAVCMAAVVAVVPALRHWRSVAWLAGVGVLALPADFALRIWVGR